MSLPPKPPVFWEDPTQHRRQIADYCRAVGDAVEQAAQAGFEYLLQDTTGGTPTAGNWTRETLTGSNRTLRFNVEDRDGKDRTGAFALIANGDRVVISNDDTDQAEIYDATADASISAGVATIQATEVLVSTAFNVDDIGYLTSSAIGASDASTVTYTQNDPNDWNQASPTVVSSSLDELASRVNTNEGDISSNEGRITTLENFRLENTGLSQALDQVVVFQGSSNTPVKSAGFAAKSGVQDPVFAPVTGEPGDVYVLRSGVNSALYQNRGATTGSAWANIGVAPSISYSPSNSDDWLNVPSEVKSALDELATRSRRIAIGAGWVRGSSNMNVRGTEDWKKYTGLATFTRPSGGSSDPYNLWDATNNTFDLSGLTALPSGWHYAVEISAQALGVHPDDTGVLYIGIGSSSSEPGSGGTITLASGMSTSKKDLVVSGDAAALCNLTAPILSLDETSSDEVSLWVAGSGDGDSKDITVQGNQSTWLSVEIYIEQDGITSP